MNYSSSEAVKLIKVSDVLICSLFRKKRTKFVGSFRPT